MATAVRFGFRRYVISVQYHGGTFLGFSYQGDQENAVTSNGTDLRGIYSVEGRLRQAWHHLVGPTKFENVQVSSRTDRGVHALKNTLHVDLCMERGLDPHRIQRGMNYFLSRSQRLQNPDDKAFMQEVRVLNVKEAPLKMANPWFNAESDPSEAEFVDWNARFSATQRTYVYRIIHAVDDPFSGVPFEHDRSWRTQGTTPLDVAQMKEAANHLIGKHDFSSFRGKGCQRTDPIVCIDNMQVHSQPFHAMGFLNGSDLLDPSAACQLVTISVQGNAFLYRQVRNMVGCLIEVGLQRMSSSAVPELLAARDRSQAPLMAPARGLFLANVKHGDFCI